MANERAGGSDGASAQRDLRFMVFTTHPDVGKDDCVCSLCLRRIDVGEGPIRIFGRQKGEEGKGIELRFHTIPCFMLLVPIFRDRDFTLSGEGLEYGEDDD